MSKIIFSVGDKVRIKSWETMEKEFGVRPTGSISCMFTFTSEMRHLEGKEFTITGINGNEVLGLTTKHNISKDMIEMVEKHKLFYDRVTLTLDIDEEHQVVRVLNPSGRNKQYTSLLVGYKGDPEEFSLEEIIGEAIASAIGVPTNTEHRPKNGDKLTDEDKAEFFSKCTRRDLLNGLMALEFMDDLKSGKIMEDLAGNLKDFLNQKHKM